MVDCVNIYFSYLARWAGESLLLQILVKGGHRPSLNTVLLPIIIVNWEHLKCVHTSIFLSDACPVET